jgi:hypothetical protein
MATGVNPMPNEFAVQPTLDPEFPRLVRVWRDSEVGLDVPKDPGDNLNWRAAMLRAAETDSQLQQDLVTAASKSLLFFVNAFCFTLRVFEPGGSGKNRQAENKHVPFVTWAVQDEHLLRVEQAIDEGDDLLTDKSRDMGATWGHIVVLTHRLLFRDQESFLMISRKEDAVDVLDGLPKNYPHGTVADPGTLFGKIDYILSRLPEWMLPRLSRKKMHVVNLDTGARIDGESSNASAGSSDRRTAIFLDEMAKMKEAESIKRSTKDVTACRLVCSTPDGAGTTYSKWRMSGQIDVFVLPWWEHPEKGKLRYATQDELGRWKIRSPWYDVECTKRSPKEIAIELDMDHIGSGDTFFEGTVLEEHKRLFATPPKTLLTIGFRKQLAEADIPAVLAKADHSLVTVKRGGPWKVWTSLVQGRPDQKYTYVVGCDISLGMGASNSTVTVKCRETGEKIMAYADANTPPYEFAKVVCAACLWVGGRDRRPLLIWENNGNPGFDFSRQIAHVYQYPNIYFDRAEGTLREKVGKRYGWRSSPEKKAIALGLLRRAYAHGGFINRDEMALTEASTYVNFEGGGIGPALLVTESDSTRKAHGDRVIADMLTVLVDNSQTTALPTPVRPERSFAARLTAFKRAKLRRGPAKEFDFRHAS